jgi:enoyl-CoA hydratase/3-hydroxyacyl-CoA dehydrogenase
VVEAVFEDFEVKKQVFARLEESCRPEAVLATNTSSFLVTDLAASLRHPERMVGLHYFYHPAKNRLVEVVPGARTTEEVRQSAWSVQEQMGKTPIHSADASGFVVNRFFVPWLNEAVRLLDEGVADIPTIEETCKRTFGVGMGPFELMNVTGVPIALHAATTLGEKFGPLYAPDDRLARQVAAGDPWPLDGEPQAAESAASKAAAERMLAVVYYVAAALVDEGVGSVEDTDIGARVGLRWPRGPFQMMNRHGIAAAAELARGVARRWDAPVPAKLERQAQSGKPFAFRLVRSETSDGIATLTVNRPDAMNALNEEVVAQLRSAFDAAAADAAVRGIVIAGAGKAFIAGADIRFFVRNIEAQRIDRIVEFTREGHALLDAIDRCPKPVVARMHGLALGGGLELALACDRIVASDKAALAFPETGIGIYPGLGGTQRAPRRIGPGLAKWLIYTGRTLTAQEALAAGLVDFVESHADLDGRIAALIDDGPPAPAAPKQELAGELEPIARLFESHDLAALLDGSAEVDAESATGKALKPLRYKAPVALRLAERLIDAAAATDLAHGLAMELEHLSEIFGTADALEGLSSLGRRRPTFQGK